MIGVMNYLVEYEQYRKCFPNITKHTQSIKNCEISKCANEE